MGHIPDELSADEARHLYSQGEISSDEARHLSGGSFNPDGRGRNCGWNAMGQKGYWNENDRWVPVRDD